MNGRMATGQVDVLSDMTPTYISYNQDVYTVQKITEDAWNWGNSATGGALSIASGSKIVKQLADGNTSGFFLESGPVADQTFAGGSPATSPTLYIGGSDYSSIYVPGSK